MTTGMYLSFADETGFLGGAFIREQDVVTAAAVAWQLDINPGGEVAGLGPGPLPPSEWVERLLTREELAELDRVLIGEEE